MHPQFVEAVKRLAVAKETYGRAVVSLDRQYLKPLIGDGDPKVLKDITALRATYRDVEAEVAEVSDKAEALEQPEPADVAPAKKVAKKK